MGDDALMYETVIISSKVTEPVISSLAISFLAVVKVKKAPKSGKGASQKTQVGILKKLAMCCDLVVTQKARKSRIKKVLQHFIY